MADVFLSYSSADRELIRGLDAELVAAGYTVYWDDMLLSGERFQDALTAQINAAVAVVVIWTPSSVRSDWVYSEARRGVEQKKVVQVRTRDLTIDDLPAPFDAFHCPFLDDTGNRFGTGMIIFRAATRAEAEKIANSEPYIAHGTRRLKLVPWQRIAGH